jgi:hypothetical protein
VLYEVTVHPDSSTEFYYDILFRNQPGAHPIDFVDIGLPKNDMNYRVLETGRDDVPAASWGPSEFVHPGIAVGLRNPIPPDESGRFYFRMNVNNLMVYEDTTKEGYASIQVTPTWFGSAYLVGVSNVIVRVILPPGIKPDEVLYQDVPFTDKKVVDGNVVVEFHRTYLFAQPFRVGVSFPSRNMTNVIDFSMWDLIKQWYAANSRYFNVLFIPLTLFLVSWALIRAGGKGCIGPLVFFAFFYLTIGQLFGKLFFFLFALVAAAFVEWLRRRRRPKYLPAFVSVEGGGVKRGLTAPEAAVLLELPSKKIIALVLFGLMKKGFIRQKSADPLEFEVISPAPDNSVLHNYETEAIKRLKPPSSYLPGKSYPVKEIDFERVISRIIVDLKPKIKGHDVDETRTYYKQIVSRAWLEAKGIGEVEALNKKIDEKIDWMMLDNDFEDRFRPYNSRYTPRYSFPTTGSTISTGPSTKTTTGPSVGPRITDIAGSMSGWMQNTAGSVASSLFAPADKPLFDGSKYFKSSGGSSRGGGGGGGCACACAGCACACACAGGGR